MASGTTTERVSWPKAVGVAVKCRHCQCVRYAAFPSSYDICGPRDYRVQCNDCGRLLLLWHAATTGV